MRCLELKKSDSRINGVTIDTGGHNQCYCEINRDSWNEVDQYQSCEFQYSKLVFHRHKERMKECTILIVIKYKLFPWIHAA